MRTVLTSTIDLLQSKSVTKIFGNPGSNEIPFLAGLPDGIDFVLGLHEQVVVGLAEGYYRSTGQVPVLNLHAASGSGNAMGALTNAFYGHTPMVIIAGQQVRRTVGQEVMLSSVDANVLPQPLVKYSHEPLSPNDVPRALSQAFLEAESHPQGPVYLSVPLDDWAHEGLATDSMLLEREITNFAGLGTTVIEALVDELDQGKRIALVVGPQVDAAAVQDPRVFDGVVELAEKLDASTYIAPSPDRCPFPTTHPNYEGVLLPGIESVRDALAKYDVVLALGSAVFRYHRWEPSEYLADEKIKFLHITQDARQATRAPFGTSYVADVGISTLQLAEAVTDRGVRRGQRGTREQVEPVLSRDGLTGTQILATLNEYTDDSVVYVNETTSLDVDYLERVVIERPGMYNFPASGGLGFGLPVAVGMAIGDPSKTVVATVGDGSANFGISALYTAAEQRTKTIFLIINNEGYGALEGFSRRMNAANVPGLKLNRIDFASIAQGYGVPGVRVETLTEFRDAYEQALTTDGPTLIDIRVV